MLEKAAQRMVSVRQRILAPSLFRRKGHDALGKIEGSVMAYGQRCQKDLGVFGRQRVHFPEQAIKERFVGYTPAGFEAFLKIITGPKPLETHVAPIAMKIREVRPTAIQEDRKEPPVSHTPGQRRQAVSLRSLGGRDPWQGQKAIQNGFHTSGRSAACCVKLAKADRSL